MSEIDSAIIIFLQGYLPDTMIKLLEFITDFGDEMAMVVVIGFFYWCLDRRFGLRLFMNLSIANIFYPMVKNVVKRLRPYMANENIQCLQGAYSGDVNDINTQGYSFPSGHVINCTTVYGPIVGRYKNLILRIALVLLIGLVGVSRFVLGVHYPSDVLAGLAFGLVMLFILDRLIEKFGEKKVYITIGIIAFSGFFFCKSNDYYTGYGLFLSGLAIILLEDKLEFENTRSIPEIIVRMALGIVIFLAVTSLLKLPFSQEFLASRTLGQYIVRTLRYAIGGFVDLGLYPRCFKYIKGGKK